MFMYLLRHTSLNAHLINIYCISLSSVKPTEVSTQGYNNSMDDQPIVSFGSSIDNMAGFMVGQTVKLQCTANIGAYNNSAEIRFLKSKMDLGPTGGIQMAPYPTFGAAAQVRENPTQTGQCQWELKSHVFYNMTAQDATRPRNNPLKFDCYVVINSINYETPEEDRPDFYIRVSKCLVSPIPVFTQEGTIGLPSVPPSVSLSVCNSVSLSVRLSAKNLDH